ncbi:Ubiquitinyl hydrolase 1 [Durusdinium trenchii]|uniref:ubiquitinyl hydrolase 1 n=1 Tax=Durusdinium trenchii TaxID=1381693 RepID=A0ABP0QP07_9DINO
MGWGGLWAAETLSEVLEPPGAPLRPAAPGCDRRSLLPCPQVSEDFWNLNSTRKRPAKVSPFYLAAWLAQLQAEGNTIFLVLGSLPTPTQPLGTEKHQLENFHELQDLQQRAERSGGNPVAAEPDSEDEGPDWLRAMVSEPFELPKPRISAEQAAASLREMGFKSSQIDIALRLASGDGEVASHFLAVMEPLENPQAEHDAATWARCMQAAVLSLDRAHAPMEFLVQGMLRVATLLDCPQVIGGADKGGILVREGQALSSKACEARLSTGAKVKELQLVSDRLRYELISGTGPTTGWVSTRISGKELLQPAASAAVDEVVLPDFEQLDDYPSMKKGTVPTGATPWLKKPLKANPDAKGRLVLFSWTGNRGGQGSAHNFQRAPGRWGEMLKEWEQLEVLYPGRATRMKDALYEDCNAYTKDIATALQGFSMS